MAQKKPQTLQRSARVPFTLTKTTRDLVSADYDGDQWYQDLAYLNCYLSKSKMQENRSEEQEQSFDLKKRPGWATHSTPAANSDVPTALGVWKVSSGEVLSAFGDEVFKNTTSLGTVTSGNVIWISEMTIGSTNYAIFVTDDSNIWFTNNGTSLTEVTDGDMPGNNSLTLTGPAIPMDGYVFVMTTSGRIYNSDIDSVSAWTSTSFISANMYPDKGRGLIRYKNQLVAVGSESMEFFTNVGNPVASPLQKNQSIAIKIGCPNQYCFVNLEDTMYFVGAGDGGRLGLYYLDGYTPIEMKDPMIDFVLKQSTATTVRLSTMKLDGCKWIIINGAFSLAYNIDMKSWMLMNNGSGVAPWIVTASDGDDGLYGINTVTDTDSNGKVFVLDYDVFQDGATNYEMRYVSPRLDMGTENQKRLHKLRIVGDKQSSTTNIDVSWSDDDYGTFTSARTINMGSVRSYITQCGSFRRRAFKLSYTGSNPVRINALEFDFSFGTH